MARDLFGAQRPQEPPPVRHMDAVSGYTKLTSHGVDREKVLDAEHQLHRAASDSEYARWARTWGQALVDLAQGAVD